MTAPPSFTPIQAEYLEALEARLAALETAQNPGPVFTCLEANLPDAAAYRTSVILVSDLNVLAHSDGSDWIRSDTGAAI